MIHRAWRGASSISDSKHYTCELVSQLPPDPCPRRKNQSICITQGILIAENLTTVPAVVFPPEQRMKLLIAFETVMNIFIRHPLILGTEGGLNNFANLFVHGYTINNSLLFYKMTNYYNAFLSQPPTPIWLWLYIHHLLLSVYERWVSIGNIGIYLRFGCLEYYRILNVTVKESVPPHW